MNVNRIRIDNSAKRLGVHVAYGIVEGVIVEKNRVDVKEYARQVIQKIREQYTIERLKEHPIIRAYRDFYWKIGIDPTKTRPSSEALIRRILRTGSMPLINNVVDAGNFASVETLVPIGIYDLDRIEGALTLRLSMRDEIFEPIGGSTEILEEGIPVLADEEKILHLYPHRDSKYTMIRTDTRRVLVIACGVPNVPRELVKHAARKSIEYIIRFAGGNIIGEIMYEH